MGAFAKSYMRKGFLIYEEMLKYLVMYEEAVSHIRLCNRSLLDFLIYEENFVSCFISAVMKRPDDNPRCSAHTRPCRRSWARPARRRSRCARRRSCSAGCTSFRPRSQTRTQSYSPRSAEALQTWSSLTITIHLFRVWRCSVGA